MINPILTLDSVQCKQAKLVTSTAKSLQKFQACQNAVKSDVALMKQQGEVSDKLIQELIQRLDHAERSFKCDLLKAEQLRDEIKADLQSLKSYIGLHKSNPHKWPESGLLSNSERAYIDAVIDLVSDENTTQLRQKDIARRAGLSVVTISTAQKSLVEKGIIKATHKYAPHPTIQGKVTRSHTEIEFTGLEG